MDRRAFIGVVTCGLVVVPLASVAQKSATVRRIGILTTDSPENQPKLDRIYPPLRALGWVVGQNLLVERRYVSGKVDLLQPFAEELVRLKVEIIGTQGTPAALAAKNATKAIPILLLGAWDPVGSGLVESLSRPGGNVTGFSLLGPEIDAKRVALLRELVPGLQRLGVLETASPYFRARRSDFEQVCRSLGVQPMFFEVATQGEVENAITEMARRGAQALMVPQEALFYENPDPLMTAASKYALPTLWANNLMAAGALAFFTYSNAEQNERIAWFVDKILRGAKPAELPIQQPTRFVLGINLKAAKALGLTIPKSILLRADEVIQ
jgi:putative tryptophan/tyrosine transport system substrate-binding protein